MDKKIYDILKEIEDNGYKAYIVGGFVRDRLLNIETNDIDIATNMNIDKLKETFKNSKVFSEYKCIKFTYEKYNFSITSFREEQEYINNKPSKTLETDDIYKDALRRDFTINSLYMDKDENIYDPLGYKEDIDKRIIRSIGNVNEKLKEDKTRILRALRFMSIYDFKLDKNLYDYIIENKESILEINFEKKKNEIDKIFKNKNYFIFLKFLKDNNMEKYFSFEYSKIINANSYLEVWASINYSEKYNFTRKEKNEIKNIRNKLNNI